MGNVIFQTPDRWPVRGQYDVVVVGAGPAGLGAACAAAKLGCRTLIVERAAFPGGVATNCCCPYLMGFGYGERQIVGGIGDELVRELDAAGAARLTSEPGHVPEDEPIGDLPLAGNVIISLDGLRTGARRLMARNGVEQLYYTTLLGAVTEGERVTAIAVNAPEGPGLIAAQAFVDATGDADLVFRAGGEVRHYPVEQSMTKTILIRVGGVEGFYRPTVEEAFNRHVAAGTVPLAAQDRFMGMALLNPGEVLLNFTLTAGDGVSAAELSGMDADLRDQAELAIRWFRDSIPGFGRCFLVDTADRVGVRAGRGIVGRETITMADLDEDAPVAESVALATRSYGGHGLTGFAPAWHKGNKGLRGVPWRALLPVSFSNVATGGRALSCDCRVLDPFRLMARCLATGQAAGVTAGLAALDRQPALAVGYARIREALVHQGAVLD
ncbi:MAG: FAD-dependent oxidoreductase [Armatimonadia bacterium]